jgi:hypothetical protein
MAVTSRGCRPTACSRSSTILHGKPQSIIKRVEPDSTSEALPRLPLPSEMKRSVTSVFRWLATR